MPDPRRKVGVSRWAGIGLLVALSLTWSLAAHLSKPIRIRAEAQETRDATAIGDGSLWYHSVQ